MVNAPSMYHLPCKYYYLQNTIYEPFFLQSCDVSPSKCVCVCVPQMGDFEIYINLLYNPPKPKVSYPPAIKHGKIPPFIDMFQKKNLHLQGLTRG